MSSFNSLNCLSSSDNVIENSWVPFWWVTVWKAAALTIAMLKSLDFVIFVNPLNLISSIRFVDSQGLISSVRFSLSEFGSLLNIFVTFRIGTVLMLGLITCSSSSSSGFWGSGTFGASKWEHWLGTKMRLSDFMSRTTLCRLSQGFPRIMRCCPKGVISIGAVSSEWSWTVKPG